MNRGRNRLQKLCFSFFLSIFYNDNQTFEDKGLFMFYFSVYLNHFIIIISSIPFIEFQKFSISLVNEKIIFCLSFTGHGHHRKPEPHRIHQLSEEVRQHDLRPSSNRCSSTGRPRNIAKRSESKRQFQISEICSIKSM